MSKKQWVHDRLRERLHAKAGITTFELMGEKRDVASLHSTEWSPEFEQLMRNRLIMGAMRYGTMKRNRGKPYDRTGDAVRRIKRYQESGNDEDLVDAANLLLLEFECGTHPNKHFASVDDGEHCKLLP